MSVTRELIRNILDTTFNRLDSAVVEKARDRIADVVGCIVSGARAPGCEMLLSVMEHSAGREEATVLYYGNRVPAQNAALVNSVMARSYEFDPTGPLVDRKSTPAHVSGTTVPVALSVAEASKAGGRELLTALILGDDLASRLIASSNLDLDSGFDCTGTANAFGAAAVAGKLWGLNEEQMANAFGIVLNQAAGSFQNMYDGVHAFKLPQGLSAQAGIFSAALARKGFTGAKDPLFGQYGYFALYCKSYTPEILTKDLGNEFCADITCMPYPCCRSNHAAMECALHLVLSYSIRPEDIEEVVVEISGKALDFAVGRPFRIREVPQIDAAFSLQYCIANALLRRTVSLEHFTDECIRDPLVMDIISRIRLAPRMPPEKPLAAKVRIRTRQGGEYEKRVDVPKGHGMLTPLTAAEKRDKFMRNVSFSGGISWESAERALSLIHMLDEMQNIDGVLTLLIA